MFARPARISLLTRADQESADRLHDATVARDERLGGSLPFFKDERTLLHELSFVCFYHSKPSNQVWSRTRR